MRRPTTIAGFAGEADGEVEPVAKGSDEEAEGDELVELAVAGREERTRVGD